ncbi:hypothetical protein EVAR_3898_1 [Eumeta japonica]|uniref:Uncharacterized protein n=1 Tax=Eumeta variegata TaxID=151549 RepID=A0A4C1STJ6_EUMVA|nr:hypothetical protein EVAR_3898_1 [Eumeta japonica]
MFNDMPNTRLSISKSREHVTKLHKYSLSVTNYPGSVSDLRALLTKQNPGLSIDNWYYYHYEKKDNIMTAIFYLADEELGLVSKKNMSGYIRTTRCYFKLNANLILN